MRRTLALVFLFAFFACIGATTISAQSAENTISVSYSSDRPGPNEDLTVTLGSNGVDLDTASIIWEKDGAVALIGVGKKSYSFTTGSVGSSTVFTITVTPYGGVPFEKTVVITPTGVDMLWEVVDGAVPPLYRGKALPGSESRIKVVAMPDIRTGGGQSLATNEAVYQWKRNLTRNTSASGYGKNSFVFSASYLTKGERIDVSATSRDGSLASEGFVEFPVITPKILWYVVSPLYGPIFDRALFDGYEIPGSDVSILAFPYYFSPGSQASSDLDYQWRLNNDRITAPTVPNVLTLHRDSGTQGEAILSLRLINTEKLFQEASSRLSIILKE